MSRKKKETLEEDARKKGEYKINLDAMKDMEFGFYGLDPGFTLVHKHPRLIDLRSWVSYAEDTESDINPNNLMAFILFLYSPDSPVNKKYGTPLLERKTQALLLSGFAHLRNKDGEWAADVVTYMIELRNDTLVAMILDYLKYLNMNDWREICTLEQELEEGYRLRMRPVASIDDKNTLQAYDLKSRARAGSKEMIDSLKSYYRSFYGEQHAEELNRRVHQYMITVESQAKQLGEK